MKECTNCNGKGLIYQRPRIDFNDYPTLIRCPECKGEGKIWEEVEEKNQN